MGKGENGKLKTKDQIIWMMLREKWAPVEENMCCGSAEYSPVKYSGLSSRRPGFESRPEHHLISGNKDLFKRNSCKDKVEK